MTSQNCTNPLKVILNNKFNASINTKRKEALRICYAIKDYFKQELNIELPRYNKGIFEKRVIYKDKAPNEYQSSKKVTYQSELDYIFEDSKNVKRSKNQLNYVLSDSETTLKEQSNNKNIDHHTFWQYDIYGSELFDAYGDLAKMYYNLLLCNIKSEAKFPHPEKQNCYETQLLACKYSKHRLDPIWNFRKSRLIRKKYTEYLKETQLHKQFQPVHLTLTVPHKNGIWNGKEFYMTELVEAFNLLRKTDAWKNNVYAGEYGVEVKPSKNHGLHIHIHSLVFQYTHVTVNYVREVIEKEWKRIVGNESDYSGIHYESLYFYKKKEGSREYETETRFKKGAEGWEQNIVKKKHYLTVDSSDEDMIQGIMECIKYHFKHDIFAADSTDFNGYDVKFLALVCRESKSKRLYSRYGAFYKESRLNFNNLESDGNDENSHSITVFDYLTDFDYKTDSFNPDNEDIETIIAEQKQSEADYQKAMAFDDTAFERVQRSQFTPAVMCEMEAQLTNPFTGEPAQRFEYQLVLSFQNSGRRMSRAHQFMRDNSTPETQFNIRMDINFKQAWALIMSGKIHEALEQQASKEFDNQLHLAGTPEEQLAF